MQSDCHSVDKLSYPQACYSFSYCARYEEFAVRYAQVHERTNPMKDDGDDSINEENELA